MIANGKETVNSSNGRDLHDHESDKAKIVFKEQQDLVKLFNRSNPGGLKGYVWDFQPSEPCSSYIYAMCAGEYQWIS